MGFKEDSENAFEENLKSLKGRLTKDIEDTYVLADYYTSSRSATINGFYPNKLYSSILGKYIDPETGKPIEEEK